LKLTGKQSHGNWPTVAVCLFLAAIVWIVFGQTVHYDFVNYDDPAYVYQNPAITQGLSWSGVAWLFTHADVNTWFPVTDITHQLDWQIYGANAGGHHLTNVLLHAATAILLFLVLRKLTGAFWRSAFVAAVFAVHPLRVESVAWVVERKDVLSGLFFMLTLGAWANHVEKLATVQKNIATPFRPVWTPGYFLALFFFALGLMSKSMLVTMPLILLLLDYWPLNRLPSRAAGPLLPVWIGLIFEKIPFLLLSVATGFVTILTQKNAVIIAQNSTVGWRVGNALLAYVDYLKHMVYPVCLTVAYSHSETNPSLAMVGLSALILSGISAGVIAGRRKHPYLLVGWLWYLGMLLPVIDIMQAAHNAHADRYSYLPQIGLYILITWGVVELCASWCNRRVALGFAAAAILTGLSVVAYVQTSYWKNSLTLWTHTLACTSQNAFADNTIGSALVGQGQWAEAITHFERALQIEPDYPEAHVNLGVALASQGRRDEAIAHFEQALRLNPNSADAHYNLGDALANEDKLTEAIVHFEQALQLKPDFAGAHYDLGLALATEGKWTEAIQNYEQALHFKLDYADAQYITGVALATEKKWAKAIPLYEQVLQQKPDYAEAHNNLGIALASQGKSDEARQQFQQALKLATIQANTALAETIRAELKTGSPTLP
jgi:tetratricopeptide (TPR) repeat protein